MAIKFPTPRGKASVKGEQKETRECYNASLHTIMKPPVPMVMVVRGGANPHKLDPRVAEEIRIEMDKREINELCLKIHKLEETVRKMLEVLYCMA